MEELKPCPFCGGKAELKTMDLSAIEKDKKLYAVWCVDDLSTAMSGGYAHGHFIDNYGTEGEAVDAWNRRDGVDDW